MAVTEQSVDQPLQPVAVVDGMTEYLMWAVVVQQLLLLEQEVATMLQQMDIAMAVAVQAEITMVAVAAQVLVDLW
jgi:hypothetical protein